MGIVAWIVLGFVVGLVARAIAPERQGAGLLITALLCIGGSLAGGIIGSALTGRSAVGFHSAGFLGSLIGAVVLLAVAEYAIRPRRKTV